MIFRGVKIYNGIKRDDLCISTCHSAVYYSEVFAFLAVLRSVVMLEMENNLHAGVNALVSVACKSDKKKTSEFHKAVFNRVTFT